MRFQPPVIGLAFADIGQDLDNLKREREALLGILRPLAGRQFITLEVLPRADSAAISGFFRAYRRIQIFHFGGHADGHRLLLEEGGNREGLKGLFALQDQLSLVFLNGCDTEEQAALYLEAGVRAVLATRRAIPDADAAAFATAFYGALADAGNPHSLLEAYHKAAADLALRRDYRAAGAADLVLYRGIKHPGAHDTTAELPWRLYVREEARHHLDWRISYQTVIMEKLRQGSEQFFHHQLTGPFRHVSLEDTQRDRQPGSSGPLTGAGPPLLDALVAGSDGELPLEEGVLALRRHSPPHCVIQGEGGAGKTVAVLRLWKRLLGEAAVDRPAPVFVALHEYNRHAGRTGFLAGYIARHYLGADLTPDEQQAFWEDLRQPLRSDPYTPAVLLLLDGFNEITAPPSQRDHLQVEIERFAQMPGVQIVLTSRHDMRSFHFAGSFHVLTVQPLTAGAVDRYLDARELTAPAAVRQQVLRNPLMLTLFAASSGIMAGFEGKKGLPFSFITPMTTYGEIMWNYLQAQLARFYLEEKNLDILLAAQLLLEHTLPRLGYEMEKNGRYALDPFETEDIIRRFLRHVDEDDFRQAFPLYRQHGSRVAAELGGHAPERVLFYALERLKMLVAEYDVAVDPAFRELTPPAEYRFLHQHFRDFFAALHLRNDILETLAGNDRRPAGAPPRVPVTLRERALPVYLRRILGELAGEHRNQPRLLNGRWSAGHFERSFLGQTLDRSRGLEGLETLGFTLPNILQTWVDLRGELAGERLDALDLRGFLFNGVRLSRGPAGRDLAASFSGACVSPAAMFHPSHPGRICCAIYVPAGSLVISGYRDGVLLLQDARSRLQQWKVKHHDRKLVELALSPDGRHGYSASEDGRVCVWQVADGRLLRTLQLDIEPDPASPSRRMIVDGTYFSLDLQATTLMFLTFDVAHNRACGTCNDGTLRVFSLDDGACLATIVPETAVQWLGAIIPHPDGRRYFIGRDREAGLWDPGERLIMLFEPGKHQHHITCLALSPDGARLLSGDEAGGLAEWDAASGQMRQYLPGHEKGITALAYAPDGKTALSGAKDGIIREWTLDAGQTLKRFPGHSGLVSALQYHPDGLSAVSAGWDDRICEWDLRTGACLQVLEGYNHIVRSADCTGDGGRVVIVSENREIALWSLSPLHCESTIGEPYVGAWEVRFVDGGRRLINCGYYDYLHLWDLDTLAYDQSLRVPGHDFTSLDSHPDGRRVLFCAEAHVWEQDLLSGETEYRHEEGTRFTLARYAPGGSRAVLVSRADLYLWDLSNHQWAKLPEVHAKGVYGVAFDATGDRLLSGDLNGKIVIWDLAAGAPRLRFDAGMGISALAFTPDEQAVVAAGWYHGEWRLFDAASGERLADLPGRPEGTTVRVLRALPGGGMLACSDDGYFHLLDTAPASGPTRSAPVLPGLFVQGCDLRGVRWAETGLEPAGWRERLALYGARVG